MADKRLVTDDWLSNLPERLVQEAAILEERLERIAKKRKATYLALKVSGLFER